MNKTKLTTSFLYIYFIATILNCFPFSHKFLVKDGEFDEPVINYINDFKKDFDVNNLVINMYVFHVHKKNDWVARCFYSQGTVIVDKKKWSTLGKKQKKWVVYHEIGHCRYSLEHDKPKSAFWSGRTKLSMMYPTVPPERFINQRRWNKMVKSLKEKINAR